MAFRKSTNEKNLFWSARLLAWFVSAVWAIAFPSASNADFTTEYKFQNDFAAPIWANYKTTVLSADEPALDLGGQTQPECASAALRLSKNVFQETEFVSSFVESVKLTADTTALFLSLAGEGTAADALEVSMCYALAEDEMSFRECILEWAVEKGFGELTNDAGDALSTAASEAAGAIYGDLTSSIGSSNRSDTYEHPQCGNIDVSFRFYLKARDADADNPFPHVALVAGGNCRGNWPLTGSTSLGRFRTQAMFDLVMNSSNDREISMSSNGQGKYYVTAYCNRQIQNFQWAKVGEGDCTGGDSEQTRGATPDPEKCDDFSVDKAAVCWGEDFSRKNSPFGDDEPWCTYKNIRADDCSGGANKGLVYRCLE